MLDDLLCMLSRFQYLDTPEKITKFKNRVVLYIISGLAVVFVLRNLNPVSLSAITVSDDECYIAFIIENDGGIGSDDTPYQTLVCCTAEREILFETDLSVMTAGGNCALWFEGTNLYVFTFRPNTILKYDLSGGFERYTANPIPSPYPDSFPHFSKSLLQSTYKGHNYDLTYKKQLFTIFSKTPAKLVLVAKDGTQLLIWKS